MMSSCPIPKDWIPRPSKQRTLVTAAVFGLGARRCDRWGCSRRLVGLHLADFRGLRCDVAVGELDIETLAEGDLCRRPHAPSCAIPHQGKSTLQHAVIAERCEKRG